MNKKFLLLNNYLKNSVEFATIRAKLQQNRELLEQIKELLPQPLNEHCVGLSLENQNQLILYADSSAWASRLRFFSRDLTDKLREKHLFFKKIQIKITIDNRHSSRKPNQKRTRFLSTQNSELLQKVAQHTTDPDLRAALQRLSTHTKT